MIALTSLLLLAPLLQQPEALPGPAGYAIPILDLDADTSRQVVVDREEGQYLGHVTTTLLDDGKTILAVYPKGHGKGPIVMKRSTDAGLTWSERLPVPENWATSQEVPTLFPIEGPDGTRRLIMFSGLNPIRMAHSEDDGQTWSSLESIGNYGGIVACATTMRLKDGSTIALFHDDGRFMNKRYRPSDGNRFHVYSIRSEDGGLTWSTPTVLATHPRAHLCEPLLLRSPDGKRIACLMRENSRQYNGFVCFSDDEGATWSEPQQISAALTGDRHTGTYAPDGRLFLSFRDTARRSPTQGDWVGWIGTFEDIENGTDGEYRVRLKDNKHRWDCAYPGVELLPDGTFVCTTYGHWEEGVSPYILSTRLKVEEIDALAKLSVDTWRIANPSNPATTPEPRDGWWVERQALLNERSKEAALWDRVDLVFLGDSITHSWETSGQEVFKEFYAKYYNLNLGMSGDRTQHVLWRLENGNLEGTNPRLCVLMIGTNNSHSDSGADIADGIFAILRKLRSDFPKMRILLLDIFPRGAGPDDPLRKINEDANRRIRLAADDPMIDVLDLSGAFLDDQEQLPKAIMPDLLHPNPTGYRIWAESMERKLAELRWRLRQDPRHQAEVPILPASSLPPEWEKWRAKGLQTATARPVPGTDLFLVTHTPYGDMYHGATFSYTLQRGEDGWEILAGNCQFYSDVAGDGGLMTPRRGGVIPLYLEDDRSSFWLVVDYTADLPKSTWGAQQKAKDPWEFQFVVEIYLMD